MDLYSQNILDHYKNPRNKGQLRGANAVHNEANYSCGDKLGVDLKIAGEQIQDFKFSGGGCAISQAAMSILGETIINKHIDEVLAFDFDNIKDMLGVPVSEWRSKCALLGLLTVQNAILKSKNRPLREWSEIASE